MTIATVKSPVTDLSRFDDWLAWLAARGRDDPDVRVVWVGGSAATGGYDEWSDLDVDLLCTPGEADAVHDRLLARIRADFDVDHVWELPRSTWPDGRQCFVNHPPRPGALEEPTRIVDLHISGLSDAHRFRQRRATAEWLVNRAVRRGQLPEAVQLYLGFGLAPLVRLLRVEHCPWRHDFGLRYLHEDLPADLADRVTALLPGNGDLADLSAACFAWTDELLTARG